MTQTGIVRLTDSRLNKISDSQPGGGTDAPGLAPGQVGRTLSFAEGDVLFDSTVGTLFGGRYQYVLTKTAPVTTPAVGLVAYWSDRTKYTVTADENDDVAGIFINAAGDNKYCLIAVPPCEVNVKFKSPTTKGGAEGTGDIAVSKGGTGLADVLADATNVTWTTSHRALGQLLGAIGAVTANFAKVALRFYHLKE